MTQETSHEIAISNLFEIVGKSQQESAMRSWLTGKTPKSAIQQREARGGKMVDFVNAYYMTRQATLITGGRWSHETIDERARPNWDNPVELGTKVKITIYDKQGNAYVHTAWGSKDVARYAEKKDKQGKILNPDQANKIISLYDDMKAAETDAIKKALSYFGIADDIYGHRELTFDDLTAETSSDVSIEDKRSMFTKFVEKNHISYSEVFTILNIKDLSDITDFAKAYEEVKKVKGI
jgi:hypothetical protein